MNQLPLAGWPRPLRRTSSKRNRRGVKAAAITGPGVVDVLDQPVPRAHGDLVVVKILVAPMCTEFKGRKNGSEQYALGHEAAGVVVDAGTSGRVREGDR